MSNNTISKMLILGTAFLWCGFAKAGVIVGGTRIIYDGGKREAALSIKNPDDVPYLIQAWTDADGPTGEDKSVVKSPFVVTPPIFRLDAMNENMVRIIRTGGQLPEDRESVFWMNVKSIPSSSKGNKNVLQISVKTRIKLFYRPNSLKMPTADDYNLLSFKQLGDKIEVTNPTPYYVSFYSLKLGSTNVNTTNVMVPPKGNVDYTMPKNASSNQITWQAIGDYGGYSKPIIKSLK